MSDLTPTAEAVLVDAEPLGSRRPATDAWYVLRRSAVFWISAVLLLVVAALVIFPNWIADADRTSSLTGGCDLADSLLPPSSTFWFGTDQQGCDVYALTVHGARPSVAVGVLASSATVLIGATVGLAAGYFGGLADSVLSRIVDIFFGLPLLLGGIVALSAISLPGIWGVVFVLSALGWVAAARIVRSTTIEAKAREYVLAARALGAGHARIMLRHVLPNAIGPGVVVAVLSLGGFIAAEATFSFLGLGIRPPDFSWGTMISEAQAVFFRAPWTLLFPAAFLSVTVLAFVLLGEAIRDALDPGRRI